MTDTPDQPTTQATRPPRPLPGGRPLEREVARMVRVDHAGEFGAARIYDGQLAVLGPNHRLSPTIRHMAEQERRHLDTFHRLVNERRVRPTVLAPVWNVAGFALGATTALMGERALMACTAAVEEVIDDHYRAQRDTLGDNDPELAQVVEEFRAEEIEHRDTAIAHGAEDTPGYTLLSGTIKAGCRAAIWLSKRI